MYEINLPCLKWFLYGNVYTGSLGTDPMTGCMNVTTFNYKVCVSDVKGRSVLMAAYYFRLPWNARSNMDEVTVGSFEVSEFGLEVAANWLLSRYFIPYAQPISLEATSIALPEGKMRQLTA
jgi:hypothetical protein